MTDNVRLRQVQDGDIPDFVEQQLDPDATQIAGFPARQEDDFRSHRHSS